MFFFTLSFDDGPDGYPTLALCCFPIVPRYPMNDHFPLSGHHFLLKFKANDTLIADTIENHFKELHSEVDAVFFHDHHLYMVKVGVVLGQSQMRYAPQPPLERLYIPLVPLQDDHVFLYRVGGPNTHVVPKTVKEELGLDGPIDAAFMCEDNTTHVVKGNTSLLAVCST